MASVRALTAGRIGEIGDRASQLRRGLLRAAEQAGLPIRVHQAGSVLGLFFHAHNPESPLIRDDREIISRFHLAALNHGLLLAPRGMIALSTVMTAGDVDQMIDRSAAAMRDVASEL